MQIIIVIRLFTSLYAGLNSLFELDYKKLIALSTLSHLGFISLSFSRGLLILSFFHLLVHALFKSLLFLCMGDIIVGLSHSQDSRYLSGGAVLTPLASSVLMVSVINLLGVPRISGFFSKDFILELFFLSGVEWFLVFIIYVNIFFYLLLYLFSILL